ncbi:VOC family protein [Gemmatimonas sp.]|uniref:VOC family protein n=1 Tax=Gemmatimonas sp. TaxID=1962908 RepID=UPI0037BF143E
MPRHFSGLDTVIIRVRDISAATSWYVQQLGAEALYEDEEQRLAVIEVGGSPDGEMAGSTLTLWQLDDGVAWAPSSTYPILATPDAKAAHAALAAQGVAVDALVETPGVWFFRFTDLDGNTLEACEVKA